MNVYWLEQTEAEVPAGNSWLSAKEAACLSALNFPKRRGDWRLGRWTAKCALSVYLDVPPHIQFFKKIEIRPAECGAPEAFLGDRRMGVTISLSHSAGIAMCAVSTSGVQMGCDVELVEARSDAFVADYFTDDEQGRIMDASATDQPRLVAMMWSAKESTLKALREGLRLDTRSVIVVPRTDSFDFHGWSPLQVRYTAGHVFHGWFQHADKIVRTVVADPLPQPPTRLSLPVYFSNSTSRCA
jgi:4'-phosphopantetheinyl transferase